MSTMRALFKGRTPSEELTTFASSFPTLHNLGATPGGFVTDNDGSRWYLKLPVRPDHAYSEHVANQLYRRTGNAAPLSVVAQVPDPGWGVRERRPAYFSKLVHPEFATLAQYRNRQGIAEFPSSRSRLSQVPNFVQQQGYRPLWNRVHPLAAHKFAQGAATDILIHADDMHGANVGVVPLREPKGTATGPAWRPETRQGPALLPVRLDNGGSLLYYATGSRRTEHRPVLEYTPESMVQMAYRKVREALSPKDRARLGYDADRVMESHGLLVPGVQRINHLYQRHGGWRPLIDRLTPGAAPDVREDMTDMLTQRHHDLIQHVQDLLPVQRQHAVRLKG